MVISVRNMTIRRQAFSTSCWISVSHFVLQYLGVNVSLSALHARFYSPDTKSILLMSGAGHPAKILGEYAFDAGRFPAKLDPQKDPKQDVVAAIADNIRDNIPVIAAIRSPQIKGFGHAVVITAVDTETGTIAFKDPGTGSTPRPFGVDVRTVQYGQFIGGFPYRYHRGMQTNIWAYCSQIIYLRPMNEMSLFD
ncbi:MAG: hypothetical protein EA405_13470 [Rhodospirillales bacterium]|nr:MAG: hypothetical protein EA405_13470 [Rhodospirillales bacterium]